MQTLVFNTTTKSVKVTEDKPSDSKILYQFDNVPTVRVMELYYEVMEETINEEKSLLNDNPKTRVPVARFPISNTNMLIVK